MIEEDNKVLQTEKTVNKNRTLDCIDCFNDLEEVDYLNIGKDLALDRVVKTLPELK